MSERMIKSKPVLVSVRHEEGLSKSLSASVTSDYILDMLEGLSHLASEARLFELASELSSVRTRYSD